MARPTRARSFAARGDRTGWLCWCHQLTSKPRVRSWRSHRINQLGHSLVDVTASGALKRPDIKARGTGCNPHQHRCCLARRTYRSGMRDHDCTPLSGGSTQNSLGHRYLPGRGADGASIELREFRRCSVLLTFQNNQRIVRELRHSRIQIRTIAETGAAAAVATIRQDIISAGSNRPERTHSALGSEVPLSQNAVRRMRKQGRGNHNSSDIIIRTHKYRSKNKRELAFGATIDDTQH